MIAAISHLLSSAASEFKLGGLGTSAPNAVGPQALGGAGASSAEGASGNGFGGALTKAIGSLDSSQASATQASEQLATGQITDPTKAVTSVENASLEMQFASQIRNQLDSAATTIFQTQM